MVLTYEFDPANKRYILVDEKTGEPVENLTYLSWLWGGERFDQLVVHLSLDNAGSR